MTNTTKIKMVITYLRSLTGEQLQNDWRNRAIEDQLIKMGAVPSGNGCFATCYALDGFIIKVCSQDLNKLREYRNHKVFKKCVAPFYYLHESGMAVVCKLIKFVQSKTWELHQEIRRRFEEKLRKAGFAGCDLHHYNLVRVKGTRRYLVIDYGCITGN